jgi:hypothetical protein
MRAGEDLAAVVGALAYDPGDLVVGIVEDVAEEEDGALDRQELLEQVQERERERVGRLGLANRLVVDERAAGLPVTPSQERAPSRLLVQTSKGENDASLRRGGDGRNGHAARPPARPARS